MQSNREKSLLKLATKLDSGEFPEDLEPQAVAYLVRELVAANQTVTAERKVSNKLEKALQVLVDTGGIGPEDMFDDVCVVLAKVAAIRKKESP